MRTQRPRRGCHPQLGRRHWEWAKDWTGSTGRPNDLWDTAAAAAKDWETRWKSKSRDAPARADMVHTMSGPYRENWSTCVFTPKTGLRHYYPSVLMQA